MEQFEKEAIRNGSVFNSNARQVFENPELCAQFLRDFSDLDIFRNVQPEDIIDETKRYQRYLGISFESDTVKRIRVAGNDVPVYIIALLEHKSSVDFDVVMQLLRYMICIWDDYAKVNEESSKLKGFKYPPVIPIVYYEGRSNWTSSMQLKERIFMSDLFEDYIPNFRYKLVHNRRYSNDELVSNNDAISLFFMLNKIQSAEDLTEFLATDSNKLTSILEGASQQTIEILMDVVWSLCMRLNVPHEEASQCVRTVGGRNMGYLFENMDKLDIQAERRNTARERERAEKAEAELESAYIEIENKNAQLENKDTEIEKLKKLLKENNIKY
ncbi:MAG: Rpn family recombination-promoting nuclease/putative transposase [Wujia sp.]